MRIYQLREEDNILPLNAASSGTESRISASDMNKALIGALKPIYQEIVSPDGKVSALKSPNHMINICDFNFYFGKPEPFWTIREGEGRARW